MLAPALVLFAAVALLPVVELVAMSLARVAWIQGKANWRFAGIDHFSRDNQQHFIGLKAFGGE